LRKIELHFEMFGLIAASLANLKRPAVIMEQTKRWATKKMGSSKARQKRRPPGKRLGLKKYPGK
jgi:hypothetical protein